MIFTHVRPLAGRGLRPRAGERTASDHPLYRCGRLLAVLAGVGLLAFGALTTLADPAPDPEPSPPTRVAGPPEHAAPGDAAARSAGRPEDLADLGAWLDYKRNAHKPALPDEARLFYRRGVLAHRDGHLPEAIRFVRGAAELDPTFVTPHLLLASWALTRDPSQALLRYAVVIELVRKSFLLQIELVANLVFFALHGLFLGLLITSLLVLFLHQAELRHIWRERLGRRLSPGSAGIWTWGILLVPFVAGLGLALPMVVFLGMLWPLLRVRERLVFVAMLVALAAAPFSGQVLGRLAMPLREDRGPLYGIAALPDGAWSKSRQASVARLADQHPDNPFVQFGLGWMARHGGDLATAESAYRRALVLWPNDPSVMNNLANVLVAQGNTAAAIDLYRATMTADPENAAAPFNLSLVYTRQFEYRAASEAAARASALDFELVKSQQAMGTADGVLPMADLWIRPATFWRTVLKPDDGARSEVALPLAWYGRVETSSPLIAILAFLLAIASAVLGTRWQHAIPLRRCRNCGCVVCRRCSQRRRELALCPACAQQEALAESPEFARVLLARLRLRRERGQRFVRTALAALVPGYGLLAFQRVFRATLMIAGAVLLSAHWFGVTAPFSYHSWPGLGPGNVSPLLPFVGWFLIYSNSLLGYHALAARAAEQAAALAAPVRSRPSVAGRVTAKAA
ncbi:MAG: tetratricopeptide repeat protein [Candidatus Eiseniibacteriota bacterium]